MALFALDSLIELFSLYFREGRVSAVAKPLLVILLILYCLRATSRKNSSFYLLLSALACSWLGDVLLMLEQKNALFFLYGLVSFLIAHVFYILLFLKIGNHRQPPAGWNLAILTGVAIYTAGLFLFLKPFLGALQVPVLLYAMALSGMLVSSIRAFGKSPRGHGWPCIIGAIFFVISDSMLAVNRFYMPIADSGIWVMGSYMAAQWLIAKGIVSYLNFKAGQ